MICEAPPLLAGGGVFVYSPTSTRFRKNPMTLIVEDGTGLTNANTYVSEAEADAYFEIIPAYSAIWAGYSSAEKENFLRMATRALDARTDWEGSKQVDASALRWPRKRVRDRDGLIVATDVVPQAVKDATCELARIIDNEDITTGQDVENVRMLKLDVLEIEYQEGTSQQRVPQYLNHVLRGLGFFMSGTTSFGRIRKA
jgi:hypothetical protein